MTTAEIDQMLIEMGTSRDELRTSENVCSAGLKIAVMRMRQADHAEALAALPSSVAIHLANRYGDWYFTTNSTLTDEQAAALSFRATADQIELGAFVSVKDAGGQRIGYLASATYVEGRYFSPDYIVCTIKLR